MRKTLLFIFFTMSYYIAWAADSTGISDLDNVSNKGQAILRMTARWGGIALLVLAGFLFGTGKAKGEGLSWLFWICASLGLICAGFGWWTTTFTEGFDYLGG